MIRVKIIVEGETEEDFVNDLLYSHLFGRGIWVIPLLLRGVPKKSQKIFRDVSHTMKEERTAFVTTMLDLYGLPNDFPNKQDSRGQAPQKRVRLMEQGFTDKLKHDYPKLASEVDKGRFIPYLQLHEFEGLLFSGPEAIANELEGDDKLLNALQQIRNSFQTPEDIDDSPHTAPSKRLKRLCHDYDKRFHGPFIAEAIGLNTIRHECPHFGEWLTKLEHLGPPVRT